MAKHEDRPPPGAGDPPDPKGDPGTRSAGPPAPDEQAIRRELGIGGGPVIDPEDVEKLLRGALEGYGDVLGTGGDSPGGTPAGESGTTLPPMGGELIDHNLELLRDVHLQVKVELGRGKMYLRDILRLGQGSVVELERLAGDPLDIYVNDKVIARGEVLVLNENFCIRITQVFHPEELRQGA
jgi:flagellar motor switch protein FliN/FliY